MAGELLAGEEATFWDEEAGACMLADEEDDDGAPPQPAKTSAAAAARATMAVWTKRAFMGWELPFGINGFLGLYR